MSGVAGSRRARVAGRPGDRALRPLRAGRALVLVATLTATGLALTDARPDFATLAAVGAAPRTRRLMAMGRPRSWAAAGRCSGCWRAWRRDRCAYPLTSTDFGTGAPADRRPLAPAGRGGGAGPAARVAVTGSPSGRGCRWWRGRPSQRTLRTRAARTMASTVSASTPASRACAARWAAAARTPSWAGFGVPAR